ncbi:cupin-like domain-containing protein [Microbulbifer sp. YPW16]|uniref:cupin-like domain-containing protein n=1 Tax=Microbulbifer sp. YPW16 TaxID=2904242 RepID=UPI001E2B3F5A|nr:cupin-like domain-containing protein [Microbulbifer sp. YPW16]UHQ53751.1 cupin-like domain-containing protein [Microbulbifer sp. YPW16]
MNQQPCLAEFGLAFAAERDDCRPGVVPPELFQSEQPVVLRNFCSDWPAVKACAASPRDAAAYLNKFYNGMPVNAAYGEPALDGRVFYNEALDGFNFRNGRVDLRRLLQEMLDCADEPSPPTLYMASTDVSRWFPGFAEQNSAGLEDLSPIGFLWLGNRTRIAAHYDFPHNLACNIAGRRRFTLFPPEQVANLYPGPLGFAPGGQEISLVDFRQPDFERFPGFREALEAAQVAELNPGDALFLPGMWWHHVEGLDALNVLYSHWWNESPDYAGAPSSALLHAMLSVRGLSPELRQAWKALFDYYVFEAGPGRPSHIPASARGLRQEPLDEQAAQKLRADLLERMKN